jgi:hypothetical protein
MKRFTDRAGARWPITGTYCTVCGLPTFGEEEHPRCSTGDDGPVQNDDRPTNLWRFARTPVVDLEQRAA